jgi:putative ABC transport system permease protein
MLFLLIRRGLRQHLVSTAVAVLLVALGLGLVISVWVVRTEAEQSFTRSASGFDAVLGARGSKLQLVLNALFHQEVSPGNVTAEDFKDIKNLPFVDRAIPIVVGDNFRGVRLVGTNADFFENLEYAPGHVYSVEPGGRTFKIGEKEAVVGSLAFHQLGWSIGTTFHPFHGLDYDVNAQHSEIFKVVGVLAPTNTPADRVIWVPMEGVQTLGGHDPSTFTEMSAVLIRFKPGAKAAGLMLDTRYNRQGKRLTLAWPVAAILSDLFSKFDWFERALQALAYLVAVVAGASVFSSVYSSMSARKRDLAILRALGAHKGFLIAAVLGESASIGILGCALGFGLFGLIASLVQEILRTRIGVLFDPWAWNPIMVWGPVLMLALSIAAGAIPAWRAYRLSVADGLSPLS